MYDVTRTKQLRVGDSGRGTPCDRATVKLEPGKSARFECVRRTGQPVAGEVIGLKGTDMEGAYLCVRPAYATGDPRDRGAWSLTVFDAMTCGVDGRFKTERLAPGSYTITAEAYQPEPRNGPFTTGERLPSLVGSAKVTVPAGGEVKPVQIELKPLETKGRR